MSSLFRPMQTVHLIFLAGLLAAPVSAVAAEPLVWKFTPGGVQRYQLTQDMTMTMNIQDQQVQTQVKQEISMTWRIDEVQADGTAVVTQTIDRMTMKMEIPGQTVQVDSAAEQEPEGPLAAQMNDLVKVLADAKFRATMTPQGRVTEVDVPAEVLQAMQKVPGAGMMGDLATEKGLEQMVKQASFALPDELPEGKTWSQSVDIENPLFGTQTLETTYRYIGSRQQNGTTLEVFEPRIKMSFSKAKGDEAATIEVLDQESSGEFLFNRQVGRLESSRLEQTVKMRVQTQGQTLTQSLEQVVALRALPAAE